MSAHILVVEDDDSLRLTLCDNLTDLGHRVTAVTHAAAARAAVTAASTPPDLVILDVMLPDGDGYSLCREWRAAGSPIMILMLTARTLEEDLVRGFAAGADDYLAKPYRLAELFARVSALLRRARGSGAPLDTVRFAGRELQRRARRCVGLDGGEVDLTPKELDLLAYMLERQGLALSRQEILDRVWGHDVVVAPRTIDNFVSSLKKKLGWRPGDGFRIETIRGVGYRFEVD